MDRYHRQMILPQIGAEGMQRLRDAKAVIVGCGALGSLCADLLARAGVGRLVLIDRDIVEWTNLQRQVLYDENDARQGLPKAEAARRKLGAINSEVSVEAVVDDFSARNAEALAAGADVIVDGLDNFETRFLINDLAVKHAIPWVYGGAVGVSGMAATFLPHAPSARWPEAQSTPCLRCIFEEPPPPGSGPTCDTAGVLGPLVTLVASRESAEAIKILVGAFAAINRRLLSLDLWSNEFHALDVSEARRPECRCCGQRHFDFLDSRAVPAVTLCGRNAVQVQPAQAGALDLEAVGARLAGHGTVKVTPHLLRVELREQGGSIEITLFPNGRALVHGNVTEQSARSLYARYIGS